MLIIYLCYQQDRIQAARMELYDILSIDNSDRSPHVFTQPKNRSINEISESNCYLWTHFTCQQLQLLLLHLWIPSVV
jgi:hypothetical protein